MRVFLEIVSLLFIVLMIVGVYQIISYAVDRTLRGKSSSESEYGPESEWKHIYAYKLDDPTAPDEEHPVIPIQGYRRHRKGLGRGK